MYPKAADDPRWQVITYGDKSVAACATSGAPIEFAEVSRLLGTFSVHQASVEVPSALKEDIEVGITWFSNKPPAPAEAASRGCRRLVRNISDHAIKVYLPALVGPNFGGAPGDLRTGNVQETRVGRKYGVHNFMVLRPNEMFSRGVDEEIIETKNRTVSAYYIMYLPGYEGRLDQQIEIIRTNSE